MPKPHKYMEEEAPGGAPDWMVTFSDCMTLLLTFFVLLLSFATFEPETLPLLGESFARALPSIGLSNKNKKDSVYKKQQTNDEVEQVDGSVTRTHADKQTGNVMEEKKPLDFRNLKVFSIDSKAFFWGNGSAISAEGRKTLDALATYLGHQTGRIVISENGPDGNIDLGMNRSLSMLNYFVSRHDLEKSRFSISAQTTLQRTPNQRQVEITLLDRSVYE